MMSYLSVEWRKTKKFSMLMIGICFLAFCSLIGLGIYFGSAYSMVADQLTSTGDLTFNVYSATAGSDGEKVANQIKTLTYDAFPADKFKSNECSGASDVEIKIDTTHHTVTATVEGSGAKKAKITVTSDM